MRGRIYRYPHLCRILAAVISIFSLVFFPHGIVLADQATKACRNEGRLGKGETNVLYRKGQFNRYGLSYPFATYSLWGRDPSDPTKLCLRYEIENLGNATIEEFRWRDTGLWEIDLPSGKVNWLNPQTTTYKDALKEKSFLRSFERSSYQTDAWFTQEQIKKMAITSAGIELFDFRKSMALTLPAIKNAGLPELILTAFLLPREPKVFPSLVSGIETPDVNVAVTSSAGFDGEQFTVRTQITVNREDATLYAPALLATRKTFNPPVDQGHVIRTIASLADFRTVPLTMTKGKSTTEFRFRTGREDSKPVMFIVQQPLTVVLAQGSLCVQISSYSPVPIPVQNQLCYVEENT